MLHEPDHPLGEPHPRSVGWFYCGSSDCFYVVCGLCKRPICECSLSTEELEARNSRRLMRADATASSDVDRKSVIRSAGLAVWNDNEVGSTGTTDDPVEGVTHPEPKEEEHMPKDDNSSNGSVRRGRGELEALVKEVTDAFDAGKIDLEGSPLTPQRIATIIGEKKGEEKPSAGAVAAILTRWDEMGYALTSQKPFAYKAISARGKKQGLEELKEKLKAKKAAERKAAREAKAEATADA
jgi:hypothetical protein